MQVETAMKLNQIVADLYEEGDLKERLNRFYHELYDLVYYDRISCMFYKNTEDGWEKQFSLSLNWEDIESTMDEYKSSLINIDDTMPILDQDKPIVFRGSQIFDRKKRENTEYNKEFLIPAGCIYSIESNLDLRSNIGMKCNFYLFRDESKADFTEDDENIVRAFQPHLSRLFRHYGERQPDQKGISAYCNSRCVAALVVDSHFNIVEQSPSFEEMHQRCGSKLDEEIINCCYTMKKRMGENSADPENYEARLDEFPYYVEVIKNDDENDKGEYTFTCLVCDLTRPFKGTVKRVEELYELTERESAVFELLLAGLDAKEMAAELFISIPAVKKYCSAIYGKMGIAGRSQIVSVLKLQ